MHCEKDFQAIIWAVPEGGRRGRGRCPCWGGAGGPPGCAGPPAQTWPNPGGRCSRSSYNCHIYSWGILGYLCTQVYIKLKETFVHSVVSHRTIKTHFSDWQQREQSPPRWVAEWWPCCWAKEEEPKTNPWLSTMSSMSSRCMEGRKEGRKEGRRAWRSRPTPWPGGPPTPGSPSSLIFLYCAFFCTRGTQVLPLNE